MTIIAAAIVVSVVISAVSAGASIHQGIQAKDAAEKRAEIEQQRVAVTRAEAELRRQNELSALRRQARINRAVISNRAAAQNVRFTTPTSAALGAVRANLKREFEFSQQTAGLAAQADDITLRQIDLEKSSSVSRANAAIFSGVLTGIGSAASAVAKAPKGTFDANAFGGSGVSDFSTGTGNVITP